MAKKTDNRKTGGALIGDNDCSLERQLHFRPHFSSISLLLN